MKGLKYALLAFTIFFISANYVNADTKAYCVYDYQDGLTERTITCQASDSTVFCMGTKNVVVSKYSLSVNDFKINNVFTCRNSIYAYGGETFGNMNVSDITTSKKDGYIEYKKNALLSFDENGRDNEGNPGAPVTPPLTGSGTCVYEGSKTAINPINVTCKVTSFGINCSSSSNSITNNSLKPNDFATNNKIACENREKIYIKIENSVITDISASSKSGYDYLDLSKGNASPGGNGGSTPTEPPEGDPGSTGGDDESTLDLEHFCQGPVQGVFTTLGWVFFVVKIVVPLLLIIFGSIDVAKAMISSKDDELKKSTKTLVIRVIAGIIIFFIPTILNFAVKLIDNSDVYRGTFWDCTKCMLKPNGNVCSDLMAGDR